MEGDFDIMDVEVNVPYSPANRLLYGKIDRALDYYGYLRTKGKEPVYIKEDNLGAGDVVSGNYEFSDKATTEPLRNPILGLADLTDKWILLIAPRLNLEECLKLTEGKGKTYKFNEGIAIEPWSGYKILTDKNAYELSWFWHQEKCEAAPILVGSTEVSDIKEYQKDMQRYMNRLRVHGFMPHTKRNKVSLIYRRMQ